MTDLKNTKRNGLRRGFTLMELVIVVAIIGILVAIAVPQFAQMTNRANYATMQSNARLIISGLSAQLALNGTTPPGFTVGATGSAATAPALPLVDWIQFENAPIEGVTYVWDATARTVTVNLPATITWYGTTDFPTIVFNLGDA